MNANYMQEIGCKNCSAQCSKQLATKLPENVLMHFIYRETKKRVGSQIMITRKPEYSKKCEQCGCEKPEYE